MPPKSATGKEKAQPSQVDEEEDIIQAVVLADSFNSRYKPLSTNKPRALLPLCNIPLLDWTLEALVSSGVQQVFVFCCSHADQIKEAITSSRWSLPNSGVRITAIVTPEARSTGDVMRELDAKQIITSDFILVTGDIVSNLPLMSIVEEHKARRKVSKNCIMTMVMKNSGVRERPRQGVDTTALLIDSETQECLYYEYLRDGTPRVGLPREKIKSTLDLDLRIDLNHCSIDICSVDVPALFTENFDYEDLRVDFVHGVLTSDILGKTIYVHVPKKGYAARAKDTKAYANITHDVLSRRVFPLVPDDTPEYTHKRGNVYIAESSMISRTCHLKRHTQIGPESKIADYVTLENSVIGARCALGTQVSIRNSMVWDDVEIGENTVIVDSIIANGVVIGPDSVIKRGVLIGENTRLGRRATLPEFMKVGTKPPTEDDWEDAGEEEEAASKWRLTDPKIIGTVDDGEPPLEVYRWPAEDEAVDEGSDNEDDNERETAQSRKYNRIGMHDSDVEILDTSSVASSTPQSTPSGSPSTSALTLSGDESDMHSLSLSGESVGYSDAEFKHECTQSLDRAFEEGHTVENAAIELKTLRMASNVQISAVKEVIVAFLVGKVKLFDSDAAGQAQQKKAVDAMVARWGGLLTEIGATAPIETLLMLQTYCIENPDRLKLFGPMLAAFYNEDLAEDETIKSWLLDARSKHPAGSPGDVCRKQGLRLLQAISEQSSDEDEEDEDEEDEDDEPTPSKHKAPAKPAAAAASDDDDSEEEEDEDDDGDDEE